MDSGILKVCELYEVTQGTGAMPYYSLHQIKRYWFEARTIGINRQYLAYGVNQRVDMVVRIPYDSSIEIGMYVILGNNDQFRIDNATMVHNEDGIKQTELTLYRLEKLYDISTGDR